ncbi:MAG: T9SS type A sorting domain-containing protein [Candidatus Kapabacteria bacterium]|nr:T9SS type A sorting domain-containing protein [Candidatus Kapabacteria bacterium]
MKTLILFGILISFSLFAQLDLSINKNMGESEELKIKNNSQIIFEGTSSDDVMYVKKKDGTIDEFKLSEVSRIIFEGITSVDNYNSNTLKFNNYPNPFEHKTTITFTLENTNKVDLTIYDLNGNIVKTLLSGIIDKGEHKIDWDGSNSKGFFVGSGNYFYQLKVDNEILTKKLIIIK